MADAHPSSDDVVSRLREMQRSLTAGELWDMPNKFLGEVADKLERQQRALRREKAKVERLRDALTERQRCRHCGGEIPCGC